MMQENVPEGDQVSVYTEEQSFQIRGRYVYGLCLGLTVAEAIAFAHRIDPRARSAQSMLEAVDCSINLADSEKPTTDKIERRPNGNWAAGQSGNRKGRKPKTRSNDPGHPMDEALERKVKVTLGAKQCVISRRNVLLEQIINAAMKGDRHALRELRAACKQEGIHLFGGRKAIEKAIAEAGISSGAFIVTEEVLNRLSESALDELTRAVQEEAEKKKNLH